VKTGKEVLAWKDHEQMISSLSYSSDNKYLAAASGTFEPGGMKWRSRVRLWDLNSGKPSINIDIEDLGKIVFSPDSKAIAVSDGKLRLFNVSVGTVTKTFTPPEGMVSEATFSADGKLIAGGGGWSVSNGNGSVNIAQAWLWDSRTGELRRVFDNLNSSLRSVSLSADGRRLATGCTGPVQTNRSMSWIPSELKVWDTATGKELWKHHGAPGDCGTIAISPDGKAVAACDGGSVRIHGAETGEIIKELMRTTSKPLRD
jgi:WD40 repeat protein